MNARRVKAAIEWNAICQIDVARLPSYIDYFCVILFDSEGERVIVYDDYAGFDWFQTEMLKRWPQIEKEWVRVLNGSPDIRARVTAWKKEA